MDDIAINPDFYDLFGEPVLLGIVIAWLALVFLIRFFRPAAADTVAYTGMVLVFLTAASPVAEYVAAEIKVLRPQTATAWRSRSVDGVRERDPVFQILQLYLQNNPAQPLAVIDDPDGEAYRWSSYYLYPRPVEKSTAEALGRTVAGSNVSRFVISRGMPAFAADVNVSMEARHDDWMLIKIQGQTE